MNIEFDECKNSTVFISIYNHYSLWTRGYCSLTRQTTKWIVPIQIHFEHDTQIRTLFFLFTLNTVINIESVLTIITIRSYQYKFCFMYNFTMIVSLIFWIFLFSKISCIPDCTFTQNEQLTRLFSKFNVLKIFRSHELFYS